MRGFVLTALSRSFLIAGVTLDLFVLEVALGILVFISNPFFLPVVFILHYLFLKLCKKDPDAVAVYITGFVYALKNPRGFWVN